MSERVRVVHLAAYGGPYAGSFIPMVLAARAAAAMAGASFEAVFSQGSGTRPWFSGLRERGVEVQEALPMELRARTGWLTQFVRARDERILLHTHFSEWDLPAALVSMRDPSAQAIWHLHSTLVESFRARARNAIRFGLFGHLASRILCVSPGIREQALARLAPRRRTQLFMNGIDTDNFRPREPAERTAARVRLGLPVDRQGVLLFGWDWELKGGPLLLDVLQSLRSNGTEIFAAIVGPSALVRPQAAARGVEDLVYVLEPAQDTRELYAAVDVFVAASAAEGMPFALIEAIACSTPVVASDIASHRFMATEMPACRLAPREPHLFGDAIVAELAALEHDRAARLAASRTHVERDLSLTRWSERLSELYRELSDEGTNLGRGR